MYKYYCFRLAGYFYQLIDQVLRTEYNTTWFNAIKGMAYHHADSLLVSLFSFKKVARTAVNQYHKCNKQKYCGRVENL